MNTDAPSPFQKLPGITCQSALPDDGSSAVLTGTRLEHPRLPSTETVQSKGSPEYWIQLSLFKDSKYLITLTKVYFAVLLATRLSSNLYCFAAQPGVFGCKP